MIYDYLFYKAYILGKRSKNFDDVPVLAGVIWVTACVMFNVFTILLLLEKWSSDSIDLPKTKAFKYIFAGLIVGGIWIYYSYKGRYKKIISKYDEKEVNRRIKIHPILVILFYYVVSFIAGMLAAMYKNGDLF